MTTGDKQDPVDAVPPGSVVVGRDGPSGARHALVAAFALANQLGAPAAVVRAWTVTAAPRPADWTFGYVSSTDELQQAVLGELLSETQASRLRSPDVGLAPQGGATERLIEISPEPRMLVVGSRGLGGLAEVVPGSVSDQGVRYVRCPVLVVQSLKAD